MIRLPQNNIWKQGNRSDKFGDLWSSNNLDLTSSLGTLKVSPRMLLAANTTDLANLGQPACAFKFFTTTAGYIYAVADDRVFLSNGGPNGTWSEVSGTPTSCNSDQSDAEQLGAYLFVTQASTTVRYMDATGSWASATNTLTSSSGLHQMAYLRATDKIYVVDGNSTEISSIAGTTITAAAASTTSTLNDLVDGTFTRIAWIAANSTKVFIGTITTTGGQSQVYSWDGTQSSGPNESYVLDAPGSLACVIQDEVPVIIDVYGRLLKLNGATFTEIDRLPFGEHETPKTYFANATQRMVHYNGMTLNKGRVTILVNSQLWDTNSTLSERVPSGIWEYTPETGLYHKASIGQTKSNGTIADYGQTKLSLVGALEELDAPSNAITQGSINGKLLAGVRYFTDATSTSDGIFYDDTNNTLQKAGSLTSIKIFSASVNDTFQQIVARFRKFLSATDKMVVKCRTAEEDSSEFTITWASTTSFTTTNSSIVGKEGYEIEVLSGVGAGRCFHLVTTGYNATNYIATTDETITGATGTAKVRMQKWRKIGSYSGQTKEIYEMNIPQGAAVWAQFKVWFLFTGKNEIFDLTIINAPHQK